MLTLTAGLVTWAAALAGVPAVSVVALALVTAACAWRADRKEA